MQRLWQLPDGGGFVNDILPLYEEPRPAYTTIATFLRILTRKGFVKTVKTGGLLYFTPRISRQQYLDTLFERLCHDFFDDDLQQMAQFVQRKASN
ncbi:MAG: BlaI/MecI/CopY family transcriptional regulator [Bacteroidaceae bacterium]|nr:BlaI/MecI/CopY family transcriptional regulator [Bacteroidaceae bacterium]